MEANAVAPPLAKAERVYPADAGSDRRDRPARTLALPVCRTSVEGIVFARIRVNMVPGFEHDVCKRLGADANLDQDSKWKFWITPKRRWREG